MKKLKRKSLFYGKSTPVIIAIFVEIFVSFILFFIVLEYMKNEYKYILWAGGSALVIFLTFYIAYLVIHRLTPEEKKKIDTASPPEWIQVPKTMKEHFTYDPKTIFTFAMIVFVFELVVLLITFLEEGIYFTLNMAVITFSVTIIGFIITSITEKTWASMDETAVYTKIEIDHNFKIKEKAKHGTTTTNYIVFYLPDGKYVLSCGKKIPKEIIVIKYKNLIRWEDADNFKKYGGF